MQTRYSQRGPSPLCDPIFCHSVAATPPLAAHVHKDPCPSPADSPAHHPSWIARRQSWLGVVSVKENGSEIVCVYPASSEEPCSCFLHHPKQPVCSLLQGKHLFLLFQSMFYQFSCRICWIGVVGCEVVGCGVAGHRVVGRGVVGHAFIGHAFVGPVVLWTLDITM